ncbi:hypothetical protein [Paenarthrobacter sp. FR1]|uniref:hypothetical protein n=1 Tax=Paenarthrobacter sp. FR1 TaxID=3439548 RepID=UPI003DA6C7F6
MLAVVDDAQAIDPGIVADFEACVDAGHAVLLVSTERLETRNDEMVLASQAQRVIFEYCKVNIDEIGPLLSSLDNRVGKSRFLEAPLKRLEMANESTTEPWAFMYAASGGDRRISTALDKAVDNNHAAVVFSLICIAQMTTQDAGIAEENLQEWAHLAAPDLFSDEAGFRKREFEDGIRLLRAERLVTSNNGRMRASHIRVADQALRELGRRTEHNIGTLVMAFVRRCLLDPELSVRGKLWLLRTFDNSETYRHRLRDSFLDVVVIDALVDQCLKASPGHERGTALYLLWDVNFIHAFNELQAARIAEKITQWLPTITADEAFGFHWVLSGLRSRHEGLHAQIGQSVSAQMLGHRLSVHGTRRSAASWADVVRELSPEPEHGLEAWRDELQSGIDEGALCAWLSDTQEGSQPFEIYNLINRLVEFVPSTAVAAFRACSASLVASFEKDLVAAAEGFSAWFFGPMHFIVADLSPSRGAEHQEVELHDEVTSEGEEAGSDEDYTAFFDEHESELRQLASETLSVMHSVNWLSAVGTLDRRELYELENLDLLFAWLAVLSVEITDQIAEAIPTDWLDRVAAEEAQTTNGSLTRLSHVLQYLTDGSRGKVIVRQFLDRNEERIQTFPEELIAQYPDIAAERILNGRRVGVQSPKVGGGWSALSEDLEAIAAADPGAAKQYLRGSWNQLIEDIQDVKENQLEKVGRFFDLIDSLDPTVLNELIGLVDKEAVQTSWSGLNAGAPEAIKKLLRRVARTSGHIGEIARDLLEGSNTKEQGAG